MTTPINAIKPCPFCGGYVRHLEEKAGFYTERVICDSCSFHITRTHTESAIEIWNRRTPDSLIQCFIDVIKSDNHDWKNWPKMSRDMFQFLLIHCEKV